MSSVSLEDRFQELPEHWRAEASEGHGAEERGGGTPGVGYAPKVSMEPWSF